MNKAKLINIMYMSICNSQNKDTRGISTVKINRLGETIISACAKD